MLSNYATFNKIIWTIWKKQDHRSPRNELSECVITHDELVEECASPDVPGDSEDEQAAVREKVRDRTLRWTPNTNPPERACRQLLHGIRYCARGPTDPYPEIRCTKRQCPNRIHVDNRRKQASN
jgi:hypothetical protein